jgi:uncharacterized damage-inducible protein DinB
MYANIKEFITEWEEEATSTIRVFKNINDAGLLKKVKENIRSPGKIAWHITQTLTEMPAAAGILSADPLEGKDVPEQIDTIVELYEKYSGELTNALRKNWDRADLSEEIVLYGQRWTKSKVLSVIINHQIHHRAQLTVVMRMLGMSVPGIYGPSKEEWAEFGMEPQE